ncbi:MAG: twin-arginine translocase TatA/TatE family subunit [Planctomycetota bacterium]
MSTIVSTFESAVVLGLLGMPGGWEWIVLLIFGLLLFGRRLPEVGANIAKTIVGFKREINTMNAQVDDVSTTSEPASKQAELPGDDRAVSQSGDRPSEPASTPSTSTA